MELQNQSRKRKISDPDYTVCDVESVTEVDKEASNKHSKIVRCSADKSISSRSANARSLSLRSQNGMRLRAQIPFVNGQLPLKSDTNCKERNSGGKGSNKYPTRSLFKRRVKLSNASPDVSVVKTIPQQVPMNLRKRNKSLSHKETEKCLAKRSNKLHLNNKFSNKIKSLSHKANSQHARTKAHVNINASEKISSRQKRSTHHKSTIDCHLLFKPVEVKVKNTVAQTAKTSDTKDQLQNKLKRTSLKLNKPDAFCPSSSYSPKVVLKCLSPHSNSNHMRLTRSTNGQKGVQSENYDKVTSPISTSVFKQISVKHFKGYIHICICPRKEQAYQNRIQGNADATTSKSFTSNNTSSFYNYLTVDILEEMCSAFNDAQDSSTCKAVLLTSVGKIFSSGLDLQYFISHAFTNNRSVLTSAVDAVRKFVNCLIHFTKPIVAAVQGPAIGLGAAILCLCDIVLAGENACFHMPYPQQGLTPSGCASYLLPNIIGQSVANSVLYGNKTLTAVEACNLGLFSEILPQDSFLRHVIPRVRDVCASSLTALKSTKQLIRTNRLPKLVYANECETTALRNCLASRECIDKMKEYLQSHITCS